MIRKKKKTSYWIITVLIITAAAILLPSHRSSQYVADLPVGVDISEGNYSDGTYRGEATGYQPGLVVEVEIVGGAVEKVTVVEHSEIGRQFWQRPITLIPGAIVQQQNTDVDVVGGATSTSHGIMAAVEDALAKAAA